MIKIKLVNNGEIDSTNRNPLVSYNSLEINSHLNDKIPCYINYGGFTLMKVFPTSSKLKYDKFFNNLNLTVFIFDNKTPSTLTMLGDLQNNKILIVSTSINKKRLINVNITNVSYNIKAPSTLTTLNWLHDNEGLSGSLLINSKPVNF